MMIVVEGCDAAGKATQTKALVDRLNDSGRKAVLFSFPRYETSIGKVISAHLKGHVRMIDVAGRRASEDALMFQCLMSADRFSAQPEINDHLADGTIVVCDRWKQSGLVYGTSDGLNPSQLITDSRGLREADLNFFIEVSEQESLRRRPKLRDYYETNREKQVVLRTVYKALWESKKDPEKWQIVDGEQTPESVHRQLWSSTTQALFREELQ